MKKNGSALIITLLVISVIASFAFVLARLGVSEIKQSSQLEDSEMAYQAAESGIEIGLLLFRYNRNVEVPNPGMFDKPNNAVLRYNITDQTTATFTSPTTPQEKNKLYADITVYHKNSANVETITAKPCQEAQFKTGMCVPDPSPENWCVNPSFIADDLCYQNEGINYILPALGQDGVVEYNIAGISGNININWQYLHNPSIDEQKFYQMLYIPFAVDGSMIKSDSPTINTGVEYLYSYNYSENSPGVGATNPVNLATKIRLKPFGGPLYSYTITAPVGSKIDSRYTVIESTGYFGGAKRKLKIRLDRTSGTLLTPLDFLIYSNAAL